MSQRYIGGLIYNPPGGFSGYFDGSGDFLTLPSTSALAFGTGDFTVEMWVYTPAAASTQNLFTNANASTGGDTGFGLFIINTTQIRFASWNTTFLNTGSNVVVANQWNHIAVSRSGTTASIFVNGIRQATGTVSNNFSSTNAFYVGTSVAGGDQLNGYISNLRAVKGTAVYDPTQTTIIVPSGPLQAITNTSLLTCAYPTFRDGSSNNFTITVNGNTAVSTQNPFPLTQLPNPALGNQGNGVYSMSQYQALRSQNLWPAIDPYFDFVTLMLHGNGTNGAQNNTFLDSSTNNFTITRNGNTTQGTFTPYGSNWSNYFDGTGDYLSVADNAALEIGASSFSIEAWIYLDALPSSGTSQVILSKWVSGNYSYIFQVNNNSGTMRFSFSYSTDGSSGTDLFQNASITAGTWHHVAITRNSTTVRFFLNGVQQGGTQTANATFYNGAAAVEVGRNGDNASLFKGYISNCRLVVGSAVYTADFTPSTAPLTAITNTSLLTCQSNRFIDNSSNNFTITRNGDVSVQRFSPFNPTTPYAAGTIGGSGYFDGNGDFLTFATNTAFSFGTGDFTIEFWTYTGDNSIIGGYSRNPLTIGEINFYIRIAAYHGGTDGSIVPYNVQTAANILSSTVVIKDNAWHHIAFVRESGTAKLWVDGIYQGSAALSTNFSNTNTNAIGALNSSGLGPYNGYVSNVRVVKGTAVYTGTSNITVPTSPLTAISGTSVLTNFTNGGIIDNAMMNDLETVGNAQISTSVSKFGGGSLAFDGNGDWLNMLTTPNITFGSGDFTLEGWLYLNSVSGDQIIFDQRPNTTQGAYPVLYMSNAVMTWYISTSPRIQSSSLSTGVWYHFAVSRSGSSTKMFINGNQTGSTYTDTNNYLASRSVIGISAYDLAGGFLNGYLDDVRFTKYARYTANFTPQRSQWQDQ